MIIDLSESIYDKMPKAPALPDIHIWPILEHSDEVMKRKGFSNRLLGLKINEHISTHIDAPLHFNSKGKAIDEISLEEFYLIDTLVLDLTFKQENEAIKESEIRQAEERVGGIKTGDLIILNTGFHRYWGTEKYLRCPFLSLSAAKYLTDKGIKALGIDCFSIDDTRGLKRPIHLHFLRDHEIPIIESITNLNSILNPRFKSIVFPLKIKGGSGSPVRLVGVLE